MCIDEAERRLAIAKLLDQPDPPELRRGHRLRVEGKPERFALLTRLAAMYVHARLLAREERRIGADHRPTERQDVRWTRQEVREEVVMAVA